MTIQGQKIKIISKQIPFKYLVAGAVMLLGGGAYSLWRLHMPATQPTKPATTNKKVQIALASSDSLLETLCERQVAGLTNLQFIGGIDDIDII
jgi:hypothetical protein